MSPSRAQTLQSQSDGSEPGAATGSPVVDAAPALPAGSEQKMLVLLSRLVARLS